ncbi:methyltransferase domain-containing protein [Blastopirellula sp. JC732]|uniref:Methyltransferase domain-containing protein n=1 Tax=Blastopirellula sediminis TaxID=2894196 RepID=A0A9X1SMX2_9BACT|nr:methyltransferase domain-containing protein [Blastopirellula sediminis]MCC9604587.1 methyltransferase domain-containing protein [Blastopirellula sediminis]MCC9632114.1 methyltransferase domain-containing protein [Blastopirellula sediminis]
MPKETEVLGQYIPLHYHFEMLRDSYRMKSFREAIEASVQPGDKVVDLGGGTGVMSFFAARAGAEVWYCERNPELVEAAERMLQANNVADQVHIVQADAAEFAPPTPVDAVVCEMLHVGLLREKQVQVISAFQKNYIAAHGPQLPRFIPEGTLLACQPVEQCFEFEGFLATGPLFQAPADEHADTSVLAETAVHHMVWYDRPLRTNIAWSGKFRIAKAGMMNGVRFITKNALTVLIEDQRVVPWHNQFLVMPLDRPQQVEAGDVVEISFQYEAGGELSQLAASLRAVRTGESRSSQVA